MRWISMDEPQIYTYSRYWIAVNNLVRAVEGSLDKGDKCRFCPPQWTLNNKLEVGGEPDSSFVLGLHWTADGTDIFWIDFALPYIMKFVALMSRRVVHGSDISWYIQYCLYLYLLALWDELRCCVISGKDERGCVCITTSICFRDSAKWYSINICSMLLMLNSSNDFFN
jgi:hypothetical protein